MWLATVHKVDSIVQESMAQTEVEQQCQFMCAFLVESLLQPASARPAQRTITCSFDVEIANATYDTIWIQSFTSECQFGTPVYLTLVSVAKQERLFVCTNEASGWWDIIGFVTLCSARGQPAGFPQAVVRRI
eukprot:4620774-Amphidinium_carterae.1